MKQEAIQLENVQKAEELQVLQETKQKKKLHHGFDLNKTFYYEEGGEFHPGDGFVEEIKKEKKVQHEFDKETQKVITDMLRIYMPYHFK